MRKRRERAKVYKEEKRRWKKFWRRGKEEKRIKRIMGRGKEEKNTDWRG